MNASQKPHDAHGQKEYIRWQPAIPQWFDRPQSRYALKQKPEWVQDLYSRYQQLNIMGFDPIEGNIYIDVENGHIVITAYDGDGDFYQRSKTRSMGHAEEIVEELIEDLDQQYLDRQEEEEQY